MFLNTEQGLVFNRDAYPSLTGAEVEIWKVWVDEQSEPSVRSITLDELTIDELRFLGDAGFERPECLHGVKS
ncbi:hypothetical protein [Exiguobacterium sp. s142]|uniref:hypothetical protein n=1 Tax=Exiguobacterium sp. s142 TaxID=2751222 RepID=UPI001BEAD40F|nr:hypothetical protein [Exiguobacterium sp. s142]